MLTKLYSVEDNRPNPSIDYIEVDITNSIPTAQIAKGELVLLESGWLAQAASAHLRGSTPVVKVWGWETETGSVYAHEIVAAQKDGKWVGISLTPAQLATRRAVTGR